MASPFSNLQETLKDTDGYVKSQAYFSTSGALVKSWKSRLSLSGAPLGGVERAGPTPGLDPLGGLRLSSRLRCNDPLLAHRNALACVVPPSSAMSSRCWPPSPGRRPACARATTP